jgi:hypothetical protein
LKQKIVSLRAACRLKKLRNKCRCVFRVKIYFYKSAFFIFKVISVAVFFAVWRYFY